MIRRALLIEAGKAKGQKVIEGPAADIRRLRTWFGDQDGGAWNDCEILSLNNPSPSEVTRAVLGLSGVDYAFVSFSGHGYIQENARTGSRTQKIILGTGDEMDFAALRPNVDKCLLVCDACREVHKVFWMAEARLSHVPVKLARKRYTRESYRLWFEAAITQAAAGAFRMYGCRPTQVCYEDPLEGGFFTSSLIDSAASWVDSATGHGCLLAQEVLTLAANRVSLLAHGKNPAQLPSGGGEDRSGRNAFPFAVALV